MEKVRRPVVTVDDGSGLASELDVIEGMRFDRGDLLPFIVNHPEKQAGVPENA